MNVLPIGADLSQLHARTTLYGLEIVVPSRTVTGAIYTVQVTEDRSLRCNCPGFLHRGDRHHVRSLVFLASKTAKKHGPQDTQVESFHALGDRADRQREVLEWLKDNGPACNREIAAGLSWPVNRVTPRIYELRELELVKDAGRKWDSDTARNVHVWAFAKMP